jgi:hypothetical protein
MTQMQVTITSYITQIKTESISRPPRGFWRIDDQQLDI